MLRLAHALALGSLVACTTVDSDNILTSGMHAVIHADAEGDGTTTVSTTLYLESPASLNFVELVGDDRLIAHGLGVSRTMTGINFLNIVTYVATFDSDAEDEEFIVELRRTIDGGAPDSFMTLPAPFEILFDLETVSREEELVLGWDPFETEDIMSWTVEGSCIEPESGGFGDDPGLLAFGEGFFQKQEGEGVPDSCDVTVTVTRTRDGLLDPGYGHGGTIHAAQTRSVTFVSVP